MLNPKLKSLLSLPSFSCAHIAAKDSFTKSFGHYCDDLPLPKLISITNEEHLDLLRCIDTVIVRSSILLSIHIL